MLAFHCLPCPRLAPLAPEVGLLPPLLQPVPAPGDLSGGHSPGVPGTFCARSRSCPYWPLLLSCLESTSPFPPPQPLPTRSLIWTLFFVPIALPHCRSPQGHRIPRVQHFPCVWSSPRHTVYAQKIFVKQMKKLSRTICVYVSCSVVSDSL